MRFFCCNVTDLLRYRLVSVHIPHLEMPGRMEDIPFRYPLERGLGQFRGDLLVSRVNFGVIAYNEIR